MWRRRGTRSWRVLARSLVVIAFTLFGVLTPLIAPAQASSPRLPRRIVSGWLPYWTTATSTATVLANADLFNEVSPFWFSVVSSGGGLTITSQVSQGTRSSVAGQLADRGIRVMPTITDGTRPGVLATHLKSAKGRAALVKQLLALTNDPHIGGVDLDWENFAFRDGHSSWSATRPAWVAFIRSLSAQLHARHKSLAVSTSPIYDSGRTVYSGYWVYDWASIASSVDRLRIMTYDYHTDVPGPIAPFNWVEKVAAFAVTQVPAGKVELGVAAYGRDWVARKADNSLDITGSCPVDNPPDRRTHEFPSSLAPSILAAHHVPAKAVRWDAVSQERTFRFATVYSGKSASHKATSCKVIREVWYDDVASAIARSRLVYRYHLAGIAQWTIGGEQAGEWSKLRAYARSIAPTLTQVSFKAPANVNYGSRLTMRIRALTGGRAIANTPLNIEFKAAGSTRWSVVKRARTNTSGNIVVPTIATKSGRYRLTVPGTYTRLAGTGVVDVHVRSSVALRISQTNIRPGQNVILVVAVNPRIKGQRVTRQFLTNGKWVTAGSATTNAVGVVTFAFNPTAAHTTLHYRIVTTPTHGFSSGVVPFSVTVR